MSLSGCGEWRERGELSLVSWENRERNDHGLPSIILCQETKPVIVCSITLCLACSRSSSFPKSFEKNIRWCNICLSMQICMKGKICINKSSYQNKFTQLQTINSPQPCELNLVSSATGTGRIFPLNTFYTANQTSQLYRWVTQNFIKTL